MDLSLTDVFKQILVFVLTGARGPFRSFLFDRIVAVAYELSCTNSSKPRFST